jgi:hypothetical protein
MALWRSSGAKAVVRIEVNAHSENLRRRWRGLIIGLNPRFNDAATTFDQSRPHRSFGEKKENRNSGYLLPMMEFAVEKIRGRT